MLVRTASPSIGGATRAALQAFQGGIADCLSPIGLLALQRHCRINPRRTSSRQEAGEHGDGGPHDRDANKCRRINDADTDQEPLEHRRQHHGAGKTHRR
jgi:hypothetical protein